MPSKGITIDQVGFYHGSSNTNNGKYTKAIIIMSLDVWQSELLTYCEIISTENRMRKVLLLFYKIIIMVFLRYKKQKKKKPVAA